MNQRPYSYYEWRDKTKGMFVRLGALGIHMDYQDFQTASKLHPDGVAG
jgi:hypothetical protein